MTLNEKRDAIIARLQDTLQDCDIKAMPPDPNNLLNTHKYGTVYVSFNGANGDDRTMRGQAAIESWNVYVCIKSLGIVEKGYELLDNVVKSLSDREFGINNSALTWTNTTVRGYDEGQWFFDIDFVLPQLYEF